MKPRGKGEYFIIRSFSDDELNASISSRYDSEILKTVHVSLLVPFKTKERSSVNYKKQGSNTRGNSQPPKMLQGISKAVRGKTRHQLSRSIIPSVKNQQIDIRSVIEIAGDEGTPEKTEVEICVESMYQSNVRDEVKAKEASPCGV